jgi:hypothetical protein
MSSGCFLDSRVKRGYDGIVCQREGCGYTPNVMAGLDPAIQF